MIDLSKRCKKWNKEISERFLVNSHKGIGIDNFKTYCELVNRALQLNIDIARDSRDVSAVNKFSKLKKQVKVAADAVLKDKPKPAVGSEGIVER